MSSENHHNKPRIKLSDYIGATFTASYPRLRTWENSLWENLGKGMSGEGTVGKESEEGERGPCPDGFGLKGLWP